MNSKPKYVQCDQADIPEGITFHVLRRDQGQIIEVAWGDYGRAEHGPGDPYKRITDRSNRSVRYYRRTP